MSHARGCEYPRSSSAGNSPLPWGLRNIILFMRTYARLGVSRLIWVAITAGLMLLSGVLQVMSDGVSWLWSTSGIGLLVGLMRILYDNSSRIRRPIRHALLWLRNDPLDWEFTCRLTCPSAVTVTLNDIQNLFISCLEADPRTQARKNDLVIQGEPTPNGLAFFHRALGVSVSFRFSRVTSVIHTPKLKVIISFNAAIGYRQSRTLLTTTINNFFRQLEQHLRVEEAKYEASISADGHNPFAGNFVTGLQAAQLRSFRVSMKLSDQTSAEVTERRINLVSFERSDFIVQAQEMLARVG